MALDRKYERAPLGDLRAYLFVDQSLNRQAFEGLIAARQEIGRRVALIVDDWTPERTLGPREVEELRLAAELLGAGEVMAVAAAVPGGGS